jgi:hypothetical protein
MGIDTTPSTVATNALQALPFSSLIGGPLDACIEAQAKAAKTTWEFIRQVGMNEDAKGQRSAINVTFAYQKDGQMMNLVVPLLTIVPIPYIAITDVSIAFKAKISAEASSVTETATSTSMNAEMGASAGGSYGPFSAKVEFKGGFSSKKDSKATQDSKYSVEYTMDVAVKAGQESMPAGLAQVLNILQSSISTADPKGQLRVSSKTLDLTGSNNQATLTLTVRDAQGLAKSTEIEIEDGDAFNFTPLIKENEITAKKKYKTANDGTLTLTFQKPASGGSLTFKAKPGNSALAERVELTV